MAATVSGSLPGAVAGSSLPRAIRDRLAAAVDATIDETEARRRFEATLDLVDIVARQVGRAVGSVVELDDLLSFGREGLLDAARRFDESRGVPFRAYANYRVRGAIYDGVRKMARLPRRVHERLSGMAAMTSASEGALEDLSAPVAPGSGTAEADAALAGHLGAMATAMALGMLAPTATDDDGEAVTLSQSADPEAAFERAELLGLVRSAIEELPKEEAELVRRHYLEGERFDHVAAELGLSKSWASRLHTRALGRLAKRLRSH
jgi:RNA polymerase sigma factor FliA